LLSGSRARILSAGVLLLGAACESAPTVHPYDGYVMGTVAELKVVSRDSEAAEAALSEAYDELARVELLATTHNELSDVSRLNANPGGNVVLSPETENIFRIAFRVQSESDSAFCPTLGAALRAWGFPEEPHVPDPAALRAALKKEEYDLGGVAKGFGVDRAADVLGELGGCLVNVGGDLAVRGARPDGTPWRIGVQDPRDPSRLFVTLRIPDGRAVATSGDYQRFAMIDGVRYHHILDPRTGQPVRGLRSVTVIAPNCALADAWATAAFVLGPEKGLAALEKQSTLEGVLVEEDAEGNLVLHETSGFDEYVEERSP
jgi:thiamine biosynthesis lipoprotein